MRIIAIDPGTDCVQGPGYVSPNGYTRTTIDGRRVYAHRAAYVSVHGPIGHGLVVDHLCRNRACVNVEHLEVVTESVNIRRGIAPAAFRALQTHCKHGHEFNKENTAWQARRPGAKPTRACRACDADMQRRKRARNRDRSGD